MRNWILVALLALLSLNSFGQIKKGSNSSLLGGHSVGYFASQTEQNADSVRINYLYPVSGLVFDSLRFNHAVSIAVADTIKAATTLQLSYLPKTYGSVYIVDFIGDGNATHILTYTNCIVDDNAVVYDYTLNKHNLHTFIYLPGGVWYSNKVK